MQFFKTTLIGGLVFLVPVVIILAVFGKAFTIMVAVSKPLSVLLPVENVGGVALVNILALLGVGLVCFIAGMVAKSRLAKKVYQSLDHALLAIPGYAFIKQSFTPVLARFDDNAQIGFEIERLGNGQVVVYLPGAPNPWSGSIVYITNDRVTELDLSVSQTIGNIRHLGRGSAQFENQL
ncbi:MAG: hypothetical protein P8Y84_03050 [Desulfuromonadales bacterium]